MMMRDEVTEEIMDEINILTKHHRLDMMNELYSTPSCLEERKASGWAPVGFAADARQALASVKTAKLYAVAITRSRPQ